MKSNVHIKIYALRLILKFKTGLLISIGSTALLTPCFRLVVLFVYAYAHIKINHK